MDAVPNRAHHPRRAIDALAIMGIDPTPVRGNAMTHDELDRMYRAYIGNPTPGSLLESNLQAQHDNLDELNAPSYSDRVKARRKYEG